MVMKRIAALVVLLGMAVWLGLVIGATAEEEIHHHDGMSADVDRFYSTWMRPDEPTVSCCNRVDCYPTQVKNVGGTWFARQRESGNFIAVPASRIEQNRDSPDGRNHVCMTSNTQAPRVYCLKIGGGG
jgi:hypothetical protein